MRRNTVRFSAFSILIWGCCSLNIVLIAVALLYDSCPLWILSIAVSSIVFCIWPASDTDSSGAQLGKENLYSNDDGHQYAASGSMEEDVIAKGLQDESDQRRLFPEAAPPLQSLMPGLPPINLN